MRTAPTGKALRGSKQEPRPPPASAKNARAARLAKRSGSPSVATVTEKQKQGVLLLIRATQALYDTVGAHGYQRRGPRRKDRDFSLLRAGRACGVPQFQLPQRTPGQTRQARGGRQGPPGGAWAGPGAHCGVGPAWVLGLFGAQTPSQGARWSAERHSLSRPSQVAKAPYCALLSAQPRPAAGRATPWPGPPCDRPPQSVSVEEVSRLA